MLPPVKHQMEDGEKQSPQRGRRRKRGSSQDPLRQAYKHVTFTPRPSTGRPGSPHRFFQASYTVAFEEEEETMGETSGTSKENAAQDVQLSHLVACNNEQKAASISSDPPAVASATTGPKDHDNNNNEENNENKKSTTKETPLQQVVHQHANGLCVITIGDLFANQQGHDIVGVHVCATAAPDTSAASRRKEQSKMLHRSNFEHRPGIAAPRRAITHVDIRGKGRHAVYGCVWGHILEVNPNLTPELLNKDPLLDGYVAVVLPTGPFPPPTDESDDESDKKRANKEQAGDTQNEKSSVQMC